MVGSIGLSRSDERQESAAWRSGTIGPVPLYLHGDGPLSPYLPLMAVCRSLAWALQKHKPSTNNSQIFNMSKFKSTILITGGTGGLGYHAATKIAQQRPDHQIVLASRTDTKNAAESINIKLKQQNVAWLALDQSDPDKIKSFSREFRNRFPPISALLLNANLQFPGEIDFLNGFERTFAINHLGTSFLFFAMAPHLTSDARIVVTSSGVHDPAQRTMMPRPTYTTAAEAACPDAKTATMDGRLHYVNSKLCNVLWTYALDRRIRKEGKQWTVVVFDPGFVPGTGLARDYPPILRFVGQKVMPRLLPLMRLAISSNVFTAKESGQFLADLAIDPELRALSGKYFSEEKDTPSSQTSYDETKQEDLWRWTAEEVAKHGDVGLWD